MAQGFIGASGCMAYLGALKMREGYIGAARVYSAGNVVTYKVGVDTYQEEIDEGSSCLSPKTFTPALSGWNFVGWRQDTAANGNVLSSLAMGDEPVTLYAVFSQKVTVTYYNDSTSARKWSKERYYNTNNISNPTFVLTQNAISGWTARGWSTDTAANGSITYANGVSFTRDSNITLYGMYQQTITVTFYNGNTSAATSSGTRYYNPGGGTVVNPSFTLTQAGLSGWTARGWSTSTAANGGITYANGASFARDSNITLYGMYQQTITVSYSGNGATGGSTAAQTGTRYYNPGSGAVLNPSFSLQTNGFSRTNYNFSKWAADSAGGTQYAAGASITLAANTTMYAVWITTEFTMALDPYGWTGPKIVQGNLPASIDTNSSVVSTYGGLRLIGEGDGSGATAWAAAKISKTINTRGLPRATITLMLGSENKGSVMIGSSGYDFFTNGNTSSATINLDTSVTSQLLEIQVANYGDAYHACSIYIASIRFHN